MTKKIRRSPKTPSRFVKLINIDEAYKDKITTVNIGRQKINYLFLGLVDRFIGYSASQLPKLFYNKKVISTYFAGMATSKNKILILEGYFRNW